MAASKENVETTDAFQELCLEERLVELWPDYVCLYDVRSADFKNRAKRDLAFQEISTKLKQTVEWVKNKMRLLRNSYTKSKKPASSGSARKNPSKRTLWLLEKLQFLAPYVATRPTVSSIEAPSPTPSNKSSLDHEELFDDDGDLPEINSDDEADDDFNEPSTRSTKQPLKKKTKTSTKKDCNDEELRLIKQIADSASRSRKECFTDESDIFGQYVSSSLKKLDPNTRHIVQNRINNIIFEGQMGMLHHQTNFPQNNQQQLYPKQTGYFPSFQHPSTNQQFYPSLNQQSVYPCLNEQNQTGAFTPVKPTKSPDISLQSAMMPNRGNETNLTYTHLN